MDNLPPQVADVYEEPYTSFLLVVSNWIMERSGNSRLGLVFDIIRSEKMIFGGVGVYTASEICYDAGTFVNSYCIFI